MNTIYFGHMNKSSKTAEMVEYGGHDYAFCDPLPEDCPCLVCILVQKEPYQLTCCGKIFCKSCIDQLIHRNSHCPNCCADSVKERKYFPDTNAERKIKSLRVCCRNKNNGCTWTGLLRDMEDTHIPECPNEMVECTNTEGSKDSWLIRFQKVQKCDQKVQRHLLEQHMFRECRLRVVSCQYCREKGSHHYITGAHVQKCPCVTLPCPHDECELKVQRLAMRWHRQTCPKGIIKCQYSHLGCNTKIKREDIQTHNQETVVKHLELTAKTLENTTRDLKKALDQIEKLEKKQ